MSESCGRQREGERGRREEGRNRVEERGRRGGRENCRSMRMHPRVQKEERITPPETAVSIRAMVTL